MSIIDEELDKKFLDDPDNVDLSGVTEITDEASQQFTPNPTHP